MGLDATNSPVGVSVLSFVNLFGASSLPLAVDTYQRDFVWNDERIRQLVEDLSSDIRNSPTVLPHDEMLPGKQMSSGASAVIERACAAIR